MDVKNAQKDFFFFVYQMKLNLDLEKKNRRINVHTFYGAPNNSVITAVNHHLGGHYGFSHVERVGATMDPVCFMRKLLSPRSHIDADVET